MLSEPIIAEISAVIARPIVARRFRSIDGIDSDAVRALMERALLVMPDSIPAVSRDAKDDKFLATAVAAGAQFLVTEYEGVRIVTCADFIAVLQDEEPAESR